MLRGGQTFVYILIFFLLLQISLGEPSINKYTKRYHSLNNTNPDQKTIQGSEKARQPRNAPTNASAYISGNVDKDNLKLPGLLRRCGKPDNAPIINETRPSHQWSISYLTYTIFNSTIPKKDIKTVVEKSIADWTHNISLTIKESNNSKANIPIYFTKQDGNLDILGYAYFPETGNIYLDKEENWTLNSNPNWNETYLGWAVSHELGHAFGLSHSDKPTSIMNAYYSTNVNKPSIEDIEQLNKLYGPAIQVDNQLLCDSTPLDAIIVLMETEQIFIKGNYYWHLSDPQTKSGSLDLLFPHNPKPIDAAVKINGLSYLFSNEWIYKFIGRTVKSRKLITTIFPHIPSNISAAFYHKKTKNVYIFKDDEYYVFNYKTSSVIKNKISNNWQGIPTHLEAATTLNEDEILFVKEPKYYLYSLKENKTMSIGNTSILYQCV